MKGFDFVVGRLHAAAGPSDTTRRSQKIGGEPPEWLRIFPAGDYECEDGTYICDEESRRLCVEYFEDRGNDLVIDYEHATIGDGEAPAAGWIKELDDRGDEGLWARVEWTARAEEYIRAGEYRYYSPVFKIDAKSKRVVKLFHVAITNWPGSNDMNALTEQIAASVRARELKREKREGVMNVFDCFRWTLNLKMTTTNNELRTELQKLIDAIPANDDLAIVAEKAGDATTIAEALGFTEKTAVAAAPDAATVVANKTLLDELELPETATLAQTHARIGELKTRTSPEDVEKMRADMKVMSDRIKELEAKSSDEKLNVLFQANRNKVTPAKEKWLRTVAQKNGYDHVVAIVKELKEELPTTTVAQTAEPPATTDVITPAPAKSGDGRPVNQKAAERHAKVMKLAAQKNLSYDAANDELRREERAAAAAVQQ